MRLVPCPACGREVNTAAAACPQCGQPIVGAVTPPPLPRVEFPSVPRAQRADAQGAGWMTYTAVALGACVVVSLMALGLDTAPRRAPSAPTRTAAEEAAVREAFIATVKGETNAFEYITWQGATLQLVMRRQSGDMQALADATCVALRTRGARGYAAVMVLESNAYLNGRREKMGEATCDLRP